MCAFHMEVHLNLAQKGLLGNTDALESFENDDNSLNQSLCSWNFSWHMRMIIVLTNPCIAGIFLDIHLFMKKYALPPSLFPYSIFLLVVFSFC